MPVIRRRVSLSPTRSLCGGIVVGNDDDFALSGWMMRCVALCGWAHQNVWIFSRFPPNFVFVCAYTPFTIEFCAVGGAEQRNESGFASN